MSSNEPPDGFFNRWSQRKRQFSEQSDSAGESPHDDVAELPTDNVDPGVVPGSESSLLTDDALSDGLSNAPVPGDSGQAEKQGIDTAQSPTEEGAADTAAPILTDDDMPPINSLSADSDVSMFFNSGVSAALRRAALRHIFQQPKFNVRDGLNDYDGDYTVFEPLGDTITSDMKWHTARKERDRLLAEEQEREREALAQQEAEKAEAEQAETEQAEAEQAEAEQADTEQAEAEQAETEQFATNDEPADAHEADARHVENETRMINKKGAVT